MASNEARTALITIAAGIISAAGTIGVAYMSGFFQVANTDAVSKGSLDLEKLKFSNELVKSALSTDNPANSLLFYNDIGLLAGLKADKVRSYAERETERLKGGGSGASLLPSFDKSARPSLWLDRNFFDAFVPNANRDFIDALVTTGNYLFTGFGINASAARLSMFLAQIAYETAGFRANEELADYSSSALRMVFPKIFDEQAASEYAHDPERILNRAYASRLGNGPESSGDGWRFRGRGFLQFTGRANYKRISDETGIDLVGNPDMLSNPHVSLLVATVYWNNAGLNKLADQGDFRAIVQRIVGAPINLEKRRAFLDKAKGLLTEKSAKP